MTPPRTGPDRIAELFLAIRGADRTQTEAAARSGLSQGTISKAERGVYTPSPTAAGRYATALDAAPELRDELVALCATMAELIAPQARFVRRGAAVQHRIGQIERQSREIRSWQCEIVPGLVQSWSYTLQILAREPTEEWIERRRERLQVLDDPDRMIMQMVAEGVLRTVVGSHAVMREQLGHLIELAQRPNVEIGVLPQGRPGPPIRPSFHLFADRMVTNETLAGTAFLSDQRDITAHRRAWDRLWSAAARGDDALTDLDRIRRWHEATE